MRRPVPVLLMVRELGIGGCERDLTKVAVGLDRSRFEPHVACYLSEGLRSGELRNAGVPVVELPVRSLLNSSVVRGIHVFRSYVRKHGIRLVHAFDVPTSIFGVPAARMFGVPVAIASQLSYRDLYLSRDIRLLRLVDRIANAVVVNSWAVHQHLRNDEKVAGQKLYVSWNGIDPATFHPGMGELPPGFGSAPLVVGTVAALRSEKRIELLVRAFARVARTDPDVRCLIVGSGPELPALEAAASQTGVRERVFFEPARSDVAVRLRAMDIFVHASRSESFPNAVLEAMACGCAVIGSRVGGIPELVEDGVSGLLFDSGDENQLADALGRLTANAELRRRLSAEAARRAVGVFHMNAAVERLQCLYESLLSGNGVPAQTAPGHQALASV